MDAQKNPTQKWILLIIVIVLLGGLVVFMMSKREDVTESFSVTDEQTPESTLPTVSAPTGTTKGQSSATAETSVSVSDISATSTTKKSGYKDGTYSATGNYVSPGGSEAIDVTLVLKDSIVSDVTIVSKANNPSSKNWQTRFIASIKADIIGKKLDVLNVNAVSGSSLTPVGFMDAVAKIKVQAKA